MGDIMVPIQVEAGGKVAEMAALVDTGATFLALPEDVIENLGVPFICDETTVLANDTPFKTKIYGPVRLKIPEFRPIWCEVMALPAGAEPLVGHYPLEVGGIAIDMRRRRLFKVAINLKAVCAVSDRLSHKGVFDSDAFGEMTQR